MLPWLRAYYRLSCWLLLAWLPSFQTQAQTAAPAFDQVVPVANQLLGPFPTSEPTGLVIDNWGNTYVTGYFSGSAQFGSFTLGTSTPSVTQRRFLAKLDASGTYLWVIEIGGRPLTNPARTVAVDAAGNVYLVGSYLTASIDFGPFRLTGSGTHATLFVVKLAPNGTYLGAWQAEGTSVIDAGALDLDSAGNIYVTGAFAPGTVIFGTTTLTNTQSRYYAGDVFVAKLTPGGTWAWAAQSVTTYGRDGDGAAAIAVNAQGETYITGSYTSPTVDFGTSTLTSANFFTTDAFVAKVDASGQWQWAHRIGGGSYDDGAEIGLNSAGEVYVYGSFQGQMDAASWLQPANTNGAYEVYVAKLAPTGAVLWASSAGGTAFELPSGMAIDAAGNAYVTGYFDSVASHFGAATLSNPNGGYNYDAFVAKIDAAGTWQWAQQTQGSGDDRGYAVALDPSGIAWVLGAGRSINVGFSSLNLPGNVPGVTGFLARLASSPYLPLVGGIVPGSGAPGQQVTITGARFVGVTGVSFNGVPATAYSVQSPTTLVATVPVGATSGRVAVSTAAGSNGRAPVFQVTLATATAAAHPENQAIWPNPVPEDRLLHMAWPLGAAPTAPVAACLRSAVGQVVRSFVVSPQYPTLSLAGLKPGMYSLTVKVSAQAPVVYRLLLQ
ncbi:IPT/TIG domain-containing protein [Hymenobacter terricola]|uniref:IPT/TIG domain-containing protein n=1 Tax=Hymenobacter terricola TaxID=2819236 RepID=UPI001B30118A|nr:IPT/TIG domain-containing protein [Hymenobacter terricola]